MEFRTRLDANQVLKNSFDENLKALRVLGIYDEVQAVFLEAISDVLGTISDPSQTDPTQNATMISLLKGILETQGSGSGGDATAANQLLQLAELQDINAELLVQSGILNNILTEVTKNIRTSVLDSNDRVENITYADFGTKNQRVTQIDYTSSTVYPSLTVQRVFNYTLVGNNYRRDSIVWSIV